MPEEYKSTDKAILVVVLVFLALGLTRLASPPELLFDERYYIGAAVRLVEYGEIVNREHPPLAKEILALGYAVFGGKLAALRFLGLIFGSTGLYFASKAVLLYSQSRTAALLFAILMATGFLLFGLSRLAMLEPFAFGFSAYAFYSFFKGRFVHAAIAIGLGLACKWTVAPLMVALVASFILQRRWVEGGRFLVITAVAYLAAFVPAFLLDIGPLELPALHLAMLHRLSLFIRGHAYASQWWEWFFGGGHVYLASATERMTILAANPVTTTLATISLLFARDWRVLALLALCVMPLLLKPVVLIHQFLIPQTILYGAFAITVAKFRSLSVSVAILSVASFAVAFPALTFGKPFFVPYERKEDFDWTISPEAHERHMEAQRCLERPRACYF